MAEGHPTPTTYYQADPSSPEYKFLADPAPETANRILREVALLKELMFTRMNSLEVLVNAQHEDLVRVPTDVDKAVGALKESTEQQVAGLKNVIDARFESADEAVRLLQAARDRNPKELEIRLTQLLELLNQRFLTQDAETSALRQIVETQFRERDTRVETITALNKVALDAAFAAQAAAAAKQDEANQKAIDKSERAVAETLNKQSDLFKSTTDGLAAQIADIKERQTRFEGSLNGLVTTVSEIASRSAELARDFGQVKTYSSENYGRASGHSDTLAYVVAGVSILGFVALLLFEIVKGAK